MDLGELSLRIGLLDLIVMARFRSPAAMHTTTSTFAESCDVAKRTLAIIVLVVNSSQRLASVLASGSSRGVQTYQSFIVGAVVPVSMRCLIRWLWKLPI